jgi:hypothetical protein
MSCSGVVLEQPAALGSLLLVLLQSPPFLLGLLCTSAHLWVCIFAVHVVSKDVAFASGLDALRREKQALKPVNSPKLIKQFYYAPFFLGALLGL